MLQAAEPKPNRRLLKCAKKSVHNQIKRLKELEQENSRLKRAVADLTLDNQILKEVAKGNF